jgi:hypothetical protein
VQAPWQEARGQASPGSVLEAVAFRRAGGVADGAQQIALIDGFVR